MDRRRERAGRDVPEPASGGRKKKTRFGIMTQVMSPLETGELRKFLGAGTLSRVVVPRFTGPVALEQDDLHYPGNTFSDRDARAAMYVASLLGCVIKSDRIRIEAPDAANALNNNGPCFLIGSRSNSVTLRVLANEAAPLFSFQFGESWTISTRDGTQYSLPDPSLLDRSAYTAQTDYGVVARLHGQGHRQFVIAGLGSRATEGCAYYFSKHWRDLSKRFKNSDFAVVLRFPAPLDPAHCEPVDWLSGN